jgi:hypothetical protein
MIIAVCGKAGAGKDTIGDYLCKESDFKKIALADPIKRLTKDVFVLTETQMYDRLEREKPLEEWGNKTPREFLQLIGTELFRDNIDPDVWVKSLWFRIRENLKQNWVITDVRFPNELEYFEKNIPKGKFTSIKVIREGCDGKVGIAGHRSEAYDLNTEHIVYNKKDFEYLYQQINNILWGMM